MHSFPAYRYDKVAIIRTLYSNPSNPTVDFLRAYNMFRHRLTLRLQEHLFKRMLTYDLLPSPFWITPRLHMSLFNSAVNNWKSLLMMNINRPTISVFRPFLVHISLKYSNVCNTTLQNTFPWFFKDTFWVIFPVTQTLNNVSKIICTGVLHMDLLRSNFLLLNLYLSEAWPSG